MKEHPDMIEIPAGAFRMGATDFYPDEGPVREVSVDGFLIDRGPVTVAQFSAFVQDTGYVTLAERAPKRAGNRCCQNLRVLRAPCLWRRCSVDLAPRPLPV